VLAAEQSMVVLTVLLVATAVSFGASKRKVGAAAAPVAGPPKNVLAVLTVVRLSAFPALNRLASETALRVLVEAWSKRKLSVASGVATDLLEIKVSRIIALSTNVLRSEAWTSSPSTKVWP